MTPLTGDELAILLKARDLLDAKRSNGDMADAAYIALLDMLHNSYLDVPR